MAKVSQSCRTPRRAATACLAVATTIVLAFAGSARALPIDPNLLIDPNFAVCPLGTPNASVCGLDPNPVGSNGVTVGVIGNAGAGPLNPFLLFVAIPDEPSPPLGGAPAPAPGIGSSANLTISLATSAQYGQTNTPVGGYLGELTSGDIYGFAGVPDGNASMNFANMSGLLLEQTLLGTTPTSFSIYELVVRVNATPVGNNLGTAPTVYDIPLTLSVGSYVAAYGIENNPPARGTHVYDSAFTVSGLVTTIIRQQVPEPGILALVGLALLGMALVRRTRRH